MKKTMIAFATALALSTSAQAKDMSQEAKNEAIGFGSGLTAGALVGGPIGGMVGAIIGLMIGDEVNDEKAKDDAANQLVMMEKEYQQALQVAEQKAERIEHMRLVSLKSALEDAVTPVETNVQFKTASYLIEPHYQPQLDLIARSLKAQPKAMVQLEGHADPRGDQKYNQALSQQRVLSVKNYLVKQGLSPMRIQTKALGESLPVKGDEGLERYFFDRRVQIKVDKKSPVFTASN